jgi:hypothetical protein
MSSRVIKYTAKLFTNLNNIKKRVSEIEKKTGTERENAIDQLYAYFKRDTDARVNLFHDSEEAKCLIIKQCIDRDIQYLNYRCEKDLVGDENKDRCMELVDDLKRQFETVLQRVESIVIQVDITREFIESLKNISAEEEKYLRNIININDINDSFNNHYSEIKKLLYSTEPNLDKYGETRVRWIVYGYIYSKNRKFEDWLPSVVSLFREYDQLVEVGSIKLDHIKWKYYDKRNLNTGLDGLESMLMAYRADKRDYKVYNRATDETIDFASHKDEVHYTKTYTDPKTGKYMTVIVPSSQRSSVYWGWDTKWCTARIDKSESNIFKNNLFDRYYKDNPYEYLYILKFSTNMYQFHFESSQFMDETDTSIRKFKDQEEYLIVQWISDLISKNPEYVDGIVAGLLQFNDQLFWAVDSMIDKSVYKNMEKSIKISCSDRKTEISTYLINNYTPEELLPYKDDDVPIKCDTRGHFSKTWYDDDKNIHREGDLPALIIIGYGRYNKQWYKHGKLHRDGDLPAVDSSDTKEWWKDGERHRDGDLPAVETSNGNKEWYKHGKLHRDGDKPAMEESNGTKIWFKDGLKHRKGRPAVVYLHGDIKEEWWFNGELHRENGHAIVYKNGDKLWYLNGKKYKKSEYDRKMQRK